MFQQNNASKKVEKREKPSKERKEKKKCKIEIEDIKKNQKENLRTKIQ